MNVFSDRKETSLTPALTPELRLKLTAWLLELIGVGLSAANRVSKDVGGRKARNKGQSQ